MARHLPFLAFLIAGACVLAAHQLAPPLVGAQAQGQGAPGLNDAGSGQDAGDSPEHALLLPSSNARRLWSANLTPSGTDVDWYRLATSGAFCAAAEATLATPGGVTLASDTAQATRVARSVGAHKSVDVALAAPAGRLPYLGIEPQSLMMASSGSNAQGPTHYTFALRAFDHATLDPGADGESPEAGATLATAAPLANGCTAGRLSSAQGDLEDVYFLDVSEPRLLTLSFARAGGDAVTARVVTPTGATHATLASGGAVDVWTSETGRWSVVVSSASSAGALASLRVPLPGAGAGMFVESSYLLASTDGPGDPQSCRPSCQG